MPRTTPTVTDQRACRTRDLAALIGLLATVEGELIAHEVSPRLADRIRDRLERSGLIEPEATEQSLPRALSALNHRLR